MKVEFTANEEYLIEFLRRTEMFQKASKRLKIVSSIIVGISFLLLTFLPWLIIYRYAIQLYVGFVVGIAFFFIGLYIGFQSGEGMFEITLKKGFLKQYKTPISIETIFEITKENLLFKMSGEETIIPWKDFGEIKVGDEYIYYDFVEPSPIKSIGGEESKQFIHYLPIPFFAFRSAQKKTEFIELSQKYLSAKINLS